MKSILSAPAAPKTSEAELYASWMAAAAACDASLPTDCENPALIRRTLLIRRRIAALNYEIEECRIGLEDSDDYQGMINEKAAEVVTLRTELAAAESELGKY